MSSEPNKKRGGEVDANTVVERLRMLSRVIQAMRFVTPGGDPFTTPVGTLSVPKVHDQMVTEFNVWAAHWFGAVSMDVPVNEYAADGSIELVVKWNGPEATNPRSDVATVEMV